MEDFLIHIHLPTEGSACFDCKNSLFYTRKVFWLVQPKNYRAVKRNDKGLRPPQGLRCSTLTLNMIPTENKNTIHFKQRLLPNCLPHDLETVTLNGGESTSQYHAPLAVAKFTRKRKKIKSGYFIDTPRILYNFFVAYFETPSVSQICVGS